MLEKLQKASFLALFPENVLTVILPFTNFANKRPVYLKYGKVSLTW